MTCRNSFAALLAPCMLAGMTAIAAAQSALPLKGTLAEDGTSMDEPLPPKPIVTSLEASPVIAEDPPPPRRKAQADDPYAPAGIGSPVLRLYPSITAGVVYSNNANGSARNPQAATGLRLKPNLRLESDWVRHALAGGIDGDLTFYTGRGDLDTGTLDVFQRLRLDVRRHTTAEFEARYFLDEQNGSDPTEQTLSGSAALTQDFGPMAAKLTGGLQQKYYADMKQPNGATADNGDRDYTEPSAAIRTTYNEYGSLRPFLEAAVAPRIHNRSRDRFGINRDSLGLGLTAGLQVDRGPIWSGDLGLTYLHRNYQAERLGSADALGLVGNLAWSPTELTKFVMAAGTSLDEAPSANTGARPTWTASLDGTYAIRDNVDLFSGASVEIEDGGDTTYGANLGLSWKFNPVLAWTAGYDLKWLDSGTPGGDYVEHRITTGLTISR